ncbi:MAG: hypothetical protein KAU17_11220 [Spirochaetales bacterium]|nr:hypothetical protein [Spirochaetales bacterium]
MKKFILLKLIFLLFVLTLILTGCPFTTPGGGWDPGAIDDTDFQEAAVLFQEDEESGDTVFMTNDNAYWGPYGYTLWAKKGDEENPFSEIEVKASKITGDDVAGYGIIFCQYNETMLIVMINNRKEFIIGEAVSAEFTVIQEWTKTDHLREGYNQDNLIKVTYDSGTELFSLFLNGQNVLTFRDEKALFHSSGYYGYIVVISPMDEFPEIPVHVVFHRNQGGE